MRFTSTVVIALMVLGSGCDLISKLDPTPTGPGTFSLKLINTGSYDLIAFHLAPANDTTNWGTSLLPVTRLDSMEYVWMHGIAKGTEYALKYTYDSAATYPVHVFSSMATFPDTITAFGGITAGGGYGHGYNWGYQTFEGEIAAQ